MRILAIHLNRRFLPPLTARLGDTRVNRANHWSLAGNRRMMQNQIAAIQGEIWLRNQNAPTGGALDRFPVTDLDAANAVNLNTDDDQIPLDVARELAKNKQVLVGSRPGKSVVINLSTEHTG